MATNHPTAGTNIFDVVAKFNAGREPERLAMKLAKMAQSPFVFLRGSCHLFYDTLTVPKTLRDAPLAWCCGDAHFENFGSYKGNNRLVYFDINDYDEAALAPAGWDLVRLLTSIQCGADVLKATPGQTLAASESCLNAYCAAIAVGKPLWVERENSEGLVNKLLDELRGRERAAFLERRTVRAGHKRQLKLDGVKALPATDAQRKAVLRFMEGFARKQSDPGFFKVLDIGRRIAGTGSLGVMRFEMLVEGKGSPDGNYLLEIKECKPSALAPHISRLGIKQPKWSDEAARVCTVQNRMQAVDHAFLQAVDLDGLPCLFKELQPSEDRVAIGTWGGKDARLNEVVATMGKVLAWDQLRASGRSGAAGADELNAFISRPDFAKFMLRAATGMAELTRSQWQSYATRYALDNRPSK